MFSFTPYTADATTVDRSLSGKYTDATDGNIGSCVKCLSFFVMLNLSYEGNDKSSVITLFISCVHLVIFCYAVVSPLSRKRKKRESRRDAFPKEHAFLCLLRTT